MQFRAPKFGGSAHQRRAATRKWWRNLDVALKKAAQKILGIV